ncbi:AraC-like DNA-binding protein [Dysgonomonas alginatilytica]|uniref:AraC-like DNA-binding protein n=1 Tax=Dysgonomonas alginatilytica TaxID=1605892 RepID=A0A2V3PW74_9BACT|nr:AraC family transcriptional regulator [Dysgonomonas alginatilytica]PXV69044.1 AraC-like DNA-binding protein [Dysgonomonas alginatilytica]
MKLYIKNMVCPRCIMAVENTLNQLNIISLDVRLGEVVLANEIDKNQLSILRKELSNLGFELLDDSQQQLIEQIKAIAIKHVHYNDEQNLNISELLVSELHRDYSYLSKLFSTTEGITIEHFVILQKIERVKELLTYDLQTLSEIADELGYSSVAHLSAQFKKVTGLTPTRFKQQGIDLRRGLDQI